MMTVNLLLIFELLYYESVEFGDRFLSSTRILLSIFWNNNEVSQDIPRLTFFLFFCVSR